MVMADNPVLANAVNSFKEAAAAAVSETERLAATLKAIPASTQQAQAHLAALTKERDDMVASLEKETAKLQATQAQTAAAQKQMGDLQARAVADQQRTVTAAQAQADKIVAAARSDAEQKSKQAAQAFVDMQKKVNDLASQHAEMLTEIEKAAARLDAMKKTAREFAGA
jgi:chromosome segregation ATPase